MRLSRSTSPATPAAPPPLRKPRFESLRLAPRLLQARFERLQLPNIRVVVALVQTQMLRPARAGLRPLDQDAVRSRPNRPFVMNVGSVNREAEKHAGAIDEQRALGAPFWPTRPTLRQRRLPPLPQLRRGPKPFLLPPHHTTPSPQHKGYRPRTPQLSNPEALSAVLG